MYRNCETFVVMSCNNKHFISTCFTIIREAGFSVAPVENYGSVVEILEHKSPFRKKMSDLQ